MAPFRAFTKINSAVMIRTDTSLKTLTGNHTSYSYLAYSTTTFQLCVMQLLLALMNYKANVLILFLETVCLGMHSFELVRGVGWSRGDLHTLMLYGISGSKSRCGSGLQPWNSKVKKKKKSSLFLEKLPLSEFDIQPDVDIGDQFKSNYLRPMCWRAK